MVLLEGQRARLQTLVTLKSANELADIQTKGLSDQAAAALLNNCLKIYRQDLNKLKSNQQIKELEGKSYRGFTYLF